MTHDSELLRRFAETRSEEAFAELVGRHVNLVYSVALRQVGGDAHLAQDVAQTVFTALARKAGALSRHAVIGGWLYRSTRFAASDVVRAERRRRNREQEAHTMHEILGQPDCGADLEKLRPLLDEAISELGETDRDAVWLRFFESRSFGEIGARLRLSENAARMRVERALEKLRAGLSGRGVASTAAALAVALPGQAAAAAPAGLATALTHSAFATAAASAGMAGWGVFHSAVSAKIALGVAAVVSAVAVGTAVHQWRDANHGRAELGLARQRIAALERQGADAALRATEADADNAALLKLIDTAGAGGASAGAGGTGDALTPESVMARFHHARELQRTGRVDEAIAEYLWCYDVGMPRYAQLSASRDSMLIQTLAKLGEKRPDVLALLRERRDAACRRLQGGAVDFETARAFVSLNHVLQEDVRSLQLFDTIPEGDARRAVLGRTLHEPFVEARRYRDAVEALPFALARTRFESLLEKMQPTAASPREETIRKAQKTFLLRTTAQSVEALVGAGETANAAELARRLLDFDRSAETVNLLRQHTARAGHPGFVDRLATQ